MSSCDFSCLLTQKEKTCQYIVLKETLTRFKLFVVRSKGGHRVFLSVLEGDWKLLAEAVTWQLTTFLRFEITTPYIQQISQILLTGERYVPLRRITGKITERGYLTSMTETLNSTNPVSGQIGIHIGTRYRFRFRRVDHPATLPPIKSRSE